MCRGSGTAASERGDVLRQRVHLRGQVQVAGQARAVQAGLDVDDLAAQVGQLRGKGGQGVVLRPCCGHCCRSRW